MTEDETKAKSNVPEFSVGELAFSLKRTLEENYGRVRVRGELSRVSVAGSGHMYSSLKDDNAVIDAVCWKGTMAKLGIKPEEGLEVICTGRISTYPSRSNYQLIIESMELAGEGALLKMLEERRKKLAAEGLFDEERKKPLPFLPDVIGVVTSPTGAVIRDILHRLEDRFPRHVLVWPVLVQGEGASNQITEAIEGFNQMEPNAAVPRPDLLIVARGGGSLEDLMPFNEENVVRAAANCTIPLISAVGHETDTTLIDYTSDYRAPTPTGAAEIAVPRRVDLFAQILEDEKRLSQAMQRRLTEGENQLQASARALGDPAKLLEVKTQQLDHIADKITSRFQTYLQSINNRLVETSSRLTHPRNILHNAHIVLSRWNEQLNACGGKLLEKSEQKLNHTGQMLEAYSFKKTLERGYVVLKGQEGLITKASQAKTGHNFQVQFAGDKHVEAVFGKSKTTRTQTQPKSQKPKQNPQTKNQGSLF